MPLKTSKSLWALLLLGSVCFANDPAILSKDRLDIFSYEKEKNIEESAKLRKDWINPITYKYAHDYAQNDVDSKKSIITINQPIFRSGGIYNAIKYADNLEQYTHIDINLRMKALIKDATVLLFEIHKANFNIHRQELLLENALIDVERKKEQALNGFLDTSFLDEAILEANLRKNNLVDLKYSKFELIQNFNNLASGEYESFQLPKLGLIKQEAFLDNNLEIKKQKLDIEVKDKLYYITIAKYLPEFSFTYDYTKYHEIDNSNNISNGDDNERYGLNMTIPFDVRISNDIQSNKIDYLIAKTNLENIKLEQSNFFKSKIEKIKTLEQKIDIAAEDFDLYNSLLEVIVQEKEAELKTQSDVDILQNSQRVKAFDSKIFEIEKQIELLELYAKLFDE